jgi:hypothetical protein
LAWELAVLPIDHVISEGCDVFDDGILPRPMGKFCGRATGERALRGLASEDHDPVRPGEGWGLQEDSVDEREDSGVCADADSEGNDSGCSERETSLGKRAQRVTGVLDERFYVLA